MRQGRHPLASIPVTRVTVDSEHIGNSSVQAGCSRTDDSPCHRPAISPTILSPPPTSDRTRGRAMPEDRPDDSNRPTYSEMQAFEGGDSPQRIGPYRILREIGQGGMGVVYEAEQEMPVRRTVALKLIKWGMHTREVLA